MPKYTPGPWRVGAKPAWVVADQPIKDGYHTGHNAPGYYGGYLIAESIRHEADARLIAAAPDLLDACKLALERMTALQNEADEWNNCQPGVGQAVDYKRGPGWDAIRAVREAVAKAEGGEADD